MRRSGMVFNELGGGEYGVWSELNAGIDPGQWAKLCRTIGGLSEREFMSLAALVQGHRCLKQAMKERVEGRLGLIKGKGERGRQSVKGGKVPLVSVGPSGVGGEYQREFFWRKGQGK